MKNPTDNEPLDLNNAVGRVSHDVLVQLLKEICETTDSARELVQSRHFVNESDVPRPRPEGESSEDESDEEKKPAEPTPEPTSLKRQRTRYASCKNCEKEFDISTNTAQSCSYHPDLSYPDYDAFPDHEEDTHGPVDVDWIREEWPENFIFQCCDRSLVDEPCVTDWHREVVPQPSKKLRCLKF